MVVSDSSALIALAGIQHLGLLVALFESILIPPAGAREVKLSVIAPDWVRVQKLENPLGERITRSSLGAGESEAIALAAEIGVEFIIWMRSGRGGLRRASDFP